ncbi:DEAD-domain-containing protein [Choanephora cucurbitarum]|nr:DEAD-domain-containing protein [Choanephora cucurbitarum]
MLNDDFELQATIADTNQSLLYSDKTFESIGLHPNLVKGAYSMHFSIPSKIQAEAIPHLLHDPPRNLIAQAKNGTGKSVAYILAMLHRTDETKHCPQALCILPTRELARQVYEVAKSLAKFTSITLSLVLRDTPNRRMNIYDHIIIGTAGSLRDSILRKKIGVDQLKMLVLDEADQMLDMEGFRSDAMRIKRETKMPTTQFVLFSSTYPHRVRDFAVTFAPDANTILIREEELALENVVQFYLDCDDVDQKYEAVCNIYGLLTVSQSVIFCKTRASADTIADRMTEQGHNVRCLHGGMDPDMRDKMMNDFRNGEFKVLVATNMIARGIDISQVSMVVNYDLPIGQDGNPDVEAYLHRVGRTGRFGRKGVSVNLIHDRQSWEKMTFIEHHFQIRMNKIPPNDLEEAEKIIKNHLR